MLFINKDLECYLKQVFFIFSTVDYAVLVDYLVFLITILTLLLNNRFATLCRNFELALDSSSFLEISR